MFFHRELGDFTPFPFSWESLITFLEPDIVAFVSINDIKKKSFEDVFQVLTGLIQIYCFEETFTDSITLKENYSFLLFLPIYFHLKILNVIYF